MVIVFVFCDCVCVLDVDVDEVCVIVSDCVDVEMFIEGECVVIVLKEWFEVFVWLFVGVMLMKCVDGGEEGESVVGVIDMCELLFVMVLMMVVWVDDDDDARDEVILKLAFVEGVDFEIVRE